MVGLTETVRIQTGRQSETRANPQRPTTEVAVRITRMHCAAVGAHHGALSPEGSGLSACNTYVITVPCEGDCRPSCPAPITASATNRSGAM